jgi:cytochrome c-type biogenesis protein CcmH/NrfG
MRHHIRRIVPLIDTDLQRDLHILHMAAAQKDSQGEAPTAFDNLLATLNTIDEHRKVVVSHVEEIRAHAES